MYELCFIVKVVFCVGVIFMLLKKPCSLVHVCFGFFDTTKFLWIILFMFRKELFSSFKKQTTKNPLLVNQHTLVKDMDGVWPWSLGDKCDQAISQTHTVSQFVCVLMGRRQTG